MNWDKMIHNFGNVKNDTRVSTSFQYLGTEDTRRLVCVASCGCTTPVWNHETKTMNVELHVTGSKVSTITVNYPNNAQEILTLIGNGI